MRSACPTVIQWLVRTSEGDWRCCRYIVAPSSDVIWSALTWRHCCCCCCCCCSCWWHHSTPLHLASTSAKLSYGALAWSQNNFTSVNHCRKVALHVASLTRRTTITFLLSCKIIVTTIFELTSTCLSVAMFRYICFGSKNVIGDEMIVSNFIRVRECASPAQYTVGDCGGESSQAVGCNASVNQSKNNQQKIHEI